MLMQENAIYSVISPEGCAAILWRDPAEKRKAAAAFKPDAAHCLELGVIDSIVPEPAGGAHTDHDEAARLLGESIREALDDLDGSSGTTSSAAAARVSAASAFSLEETLSGGSLSPVSTVFSPAPNTTRGR